MIGFLLIGLVIVVVLVFLFRRAKGTSQSGYSSDNSFIDNSFSTVDSSTDTFTGGCGGEFGGGGAGGSWGDDSGGGDSSDSGGGDSSD